MKKAQSKDTTLEESGPQIHHHCTRNCTAQAVAVDSLIHVLGQFSGGSYATKKSIINNYKSNRPITTNTVMPL